MNKESSRSHFIFTLNVRTRKLNEVTGEDEIKDGRLYLVDLAGSESIGKSGAKGMRATEAKKINKSNEALKRVIESLCNGWSHIPYRDSKLTQLLRPALGGSAKTAIIGTVSPSASNVFETKSTCHYICMSRKIQNKPTLNQTVTQKNLVGELEREQDRLRAQLAAQRSKVGVYLPTEQYEEEKARLATLEARVQAFDDIMLRKDTGLEEKLAEIKVLSEQMDRVRGVRALVFERWCSRAKRSNLSFILHLHIALMSSIARMPIVTYSWNIARIALECTLEYYEILNSRFSLEHRYELNLEGKSFVRTRREVWRPLTRLMDSSSETTRKRRDTRWNVCLMLWNVWIRNVIACLVPWRVESRRRWMYVVFECGVRVM